MENKPNNVFDKLSKKEQLKELQELLNDGLITENDFNEKKKQILNL